MYNNSLCLSWNPSTTLTCKANVESFHISFIWFNNSFTNSCSKYYLFTILIHLLPRWSIFWITIVYFITLDFCFVKSQLWLYLYNKDSRVMKLTLQWVWSEAFVPKQISRYASTFGVCQTESNERSFLYLNLLNLYLKKFILTKEKEYTKQLSW